MNRREFLAAGAGGAAAWNLASNMPRELRGDDRPALDAIDTHTHFYDPTRPEGVPWPGAKSSLYRPVLPDEFKRLGQPLGISGTVVVEASPWVEDNQWLLDLAAKHPFVVGVVGNLDPKSDDFEKHLRRFAKNPKYRGIRVSQNAVADGMKDEGKIVERGRLLAELDLELDVNGGPEMPTHVAQLAARLPELRIVINHVANLRIDGNEPPAAWREAMTAAAKHPRIFCKVSALVEHTAMKPAPRELNYYRPVLDALWRLFGEERLIFGSNWPVSDGGAPLETVVAIVRDYFLAKGENAAKKFFRTNSEAGYKWRRG